jgi:hypothetical protein
LPKGLPPSCRASEIKSLYSRLTHVEKLKGDAVWLRYEVVK